MNRTPRGEGSPAARTAQDKTRKVVASLSRQLSFGRKSRGEAKKQSSTPPPEPPEAPFSRVVQRDVAPPPPPVTDEEEERPVELNERGEPLLTSLPEILAELESSAMATRKRGAKHLARLVDGSVGDQACLLGEYMREVGAIELLVSLLSDGAVLQLVLMVLGNGEPRCPRLSPAAAL